MKVNEFIKDYSPALVGEIMNEDLYMPTAQKTLKSQVVAEQTHLEGNKFKQRTGMWVVLTNKLIVENYTSLEFSNDGAEFLDEYDALNKYGVIDEIKSNINERELAELNQFLKYAVEDLKENLSRQNPFEDLLPALDEVTNNANTEKES